jgi:hypothetical protein
VTGVTKSAKAIGYPLALSAEITKNGFGLPEGAPVTDVIDAVGRASFAIS